MVDTVSARRFRVAVIGEGLMGAAARHLARQTAGVVLIGPDEPAVRADHDDVFGGHDDEGRIYRILDGDPIRARLAARRPCPTSPLDERIPLWRWHIRARIVARFPWHDTRSRALHRGVGGPGENGGGR